MSNRLKIIILLICIIIIGVFLVFVFYSGKKAPTTSSGILSPTIPQINPQKFEINSEIKESDFRFPSSLPVLEVKNTNPLSESEAKEIARQFGFNTNPQILTDTLTGTFYLWTNESSTLDITIKTRKVKYSLNFISTTTPKRLTEKELIATAKDFLLKKNLIVDAGVEAYVSYFKSSSGTDEVAPTNITDASFAIINFSINSGGYKVLTLDPTKSPISVKVLPDGTVTEIDLIKTEGVNQSLQVYALKDFSDFRSDLSKATIISINDGEFINPDPRVYKIQSVSARSVELIYLAAQQDTNIYQPVFLITGRANITNLGDVNVLLYLSALKNS